LSAKRSVLPLHDPASSFEDALAAVLQRSDERLIVAIDLAATR